MRTIGVASGDDVDHQEKQSHFGMMVEEGHAPCSAQIDVPHVLWSDIKLKLRE